MNKEAFCCFCGDSVVVEAAVAIAVKSNINSTEEQGFFSHKDCFKSVLDKSVVKYLHPDLY